jgi:hypothetical protein
MLPLNVIEKMCDAPDSGYSSVYMFDEDAARVLLADKSSKGMSRFPVYTDRLVIDLDAGDEQLERAELALKERELAYDVWFSGGKGYHVIIPLVALVSGKDVPYSQKKWVEGLGIGADLSLYQHGRLISLPGRVHPKTGIKKYLLRQENGAKLNIPMLVSPEPVFTFAGNGGLDEFEAGLWKVLQCLADPPSVGNRHTQLWSTALHFADSGFSYDFTLELMTEVNNKWTTGKDLAGVELAVKQAYRK